MRHAERLGALLALAVACGDAADDGAPGDAALAMDASPGQSGCKPRRVEGDGALHFHHVHFNSADPAADMAFYEALFGAQTVDFCADRDTGEVTRATKTERGYFLFDAVAENPAKDLNTFLEHVGWLHPAPAEEITRLAALDATFWPGIDHYHCAEAVAGEAPCVVGMTDYFYLIAPNNARIEVSESPREPGFGHVHMVGGTDFQFFMTLTDGAFADMLIDEVDHIDFGINEFLLDGDLVDTRGRPIDHIAYSTNDFDDHRARIESEGFEVVEQESYKADFGFRSFFVRTDRGVWVEIVEDTDFALAP